MFPKRHGRAAVLIGKVLPVDPRRITNDIVAWFKEQRREIVFYDPRPHAVHSLIVQSSNLRVETAYFNADCFQLSTVKSARWRRGEQRHFRGHLTEHRLRHSPAKPRFIWLREQGRDSEDPCRCL